MSSKKRSLSWPNSAKLQTILWLGCIERCEIGRLVKHVPNADDKITKVGLPPKRAYGLLLPKILPASMRSMPGFGGVVSSA